MSLKITNELIERINKHIEAAYPGEGAGFLLGADGDVNEVLPLENAREEEARHNRFLLTPEDYLKAEMKAMELGVDLIGVFHSHPDCPNVPSEYDREWAQPFFSYVISRVDQGKAVSHRSWKLLEDRTKYEEEEIEIKS
ncbi:MAG: M67 family metallopeptidase [Anaerolineae bacterium]|nr:M67 family metallopeptidase [Anaerolineae bacterium]